MLLGLSLITLLIRGYLVT